MNKGFQRVNSIALLLNLAGVAAFLLVASSLSWAPPGWENVSGAGVGTFLVWGETALPLLLGFFVLDLMLLILAITVYSRKRVWRLDWTYASVPVIWIIAFYVDGIHHWAP